MNLSRFIANRLTGAQYKSFTRTIIRLATGTMALSLAVMIVTLAMVRGFKKEISDKVFGLWGHISVTDIRASESYEALPIYRDTALMHSIGNIARVELEYGDSGQHQAISQGGVRHVQAVAQIPAMISTKSQMEGVILRGIGADYDWQTMQRFVVDGAAFDPVDTAGSRKLLVSEHTADRLELLPGSLLIMDVIRNERQIRRRFEVSGIYRTGLEEYDEKFAFAPITEVQDLLGWEADQVGSYEIFVENVSDAEIINEFVYVEELPSELYSETIRQKFPNIFEWLELQDINQYVILSLTLIVAVMNMISVLLILILERTRMIGVLKALGSTHWKIQKIFLYHAVSIMAKGLLIGNVVGLAICLVQQKYHIITLNESDYYLAYAPVDISIAHVIFVNIGSILVTILFLLIPSRLITRIHPVKTIRFG